LALAVGYALASLRGERLDRTEVASRLGRGRRSAVGVHGFEQGGFLAEAGRAEGEDVAPLIFRRPLPADWRLVLVTPRRSEGLSGESERRAFQELPPAPQESVDRLCRLLWSGILPALVAGDFAGFSEAVHDYGRLAGELFSAIQGGPFADAEVARLVELLRSRGVRGVGQSSWGPTVYALGESEEAAQELAGFLRQHCGAHTGVQVSAPLNHGATVRSPPDTPSMHTLV
jgi:beta-RFAP synthase